MRCGTCQQRRLTMSVHLAEHRSRWPANLNWVVQQRKPPAAEREDGSTTSELTFSCWVLCRWPAWLPVHLLQCPGLLFGHLWSSRSSQLSEIYLAKWYFWRSPSIGSLQLSIICLARPVVFGTINFYFLLQIPPFVLQHCLVLDSFIWWYLGWLFSFFQLTVSLHFVLGHFLLFGLGFLLDLTNFSRGCLAFSPPGPCPLFKNSKMHCQLPSVPSFTASINSCCLKQNFKRDHLPTIPQILKHPQNRLWAWP